MEYLEKISYTLHNQAPTKEQILMDSNKSNRIQMKIFAFFPKRGRLKEARRLIIILKIVFHK